MISRGGAPCAVRGLPSNVPDAVIFNDDHRALCCCCCCYCCLLSVAAAAADAAAAAAAAASAIYHNMTDYICFTLFADSHFFKCDVVRTL